ncbi:FmdB family zinc ribbon protein [Pseudothermotoga sp. U03pept]|uniref:FmdB family zinc ribbon protein n=1 Tax=Pseudothermotoga sp. U03pept TaxID=3447012 RepID=UPI003F08B169
MPIYRYFCEKCQKEHKMLMKMNDQDPDCPECGERMKKQLPHIQIKGKGSSSCSSNNCSGCSGCSSSH